MSASKRPKYTWPWFVLGGVLLFAFASTLWVVSFVRKVQRIKESTYGTNTSAANLTPVPAPASSPASSTNGMVWIEGGTFWMGSEGGQPDELPVHEVIVDGFWMDKTEVTNEEFEKFVRATGYVTV